MGWGGAIFLLCLLWLFKVDQYNLAKLVPLILMAVWSFRLTYHIYIDRVAGHEEDKRYLNLRNYWGNSANRNFFFFFQSQALMSAFFFSPVYILINEKINFGSVFDIFGCIIWVVSVIGESVSDDQLKQFRTNIKNKGKTCRQGLWRYSRHPNYFFEWLHWFSYLFFAVNVDSFYLFFFPPLVMLIFLFKLTGIPYTEMQAIKSRGDDYLAYQKETSVFIPWFPKK